MSLKFLISSTVALNIKLIKHISFECKILKSETFYKSVIYVKMFKEGKGSINIDFYNFNFTFIY